MRLIVEKTHPPLTFGRSDQLAVLVQMSRIPEPELKPLFDAGQWRTLHRYFGTTPQMMAVLRRNGIMLDDDESRHDEAAPQLVPAGVPGAN